MLGGSVHTTKKNAGALVVASLEEIKDKMISRIACYHSLQDLCLSGCYPKN
jgi:hypothetical protein